METHTIAQRLEARLMDQSAAAHQGDAPRLAACAEESLALLLLLRGAGAVLGGPDGATLRRYRDAAAYNQLLLRYAFTGWAAERLAGERARRGVGYDARGQTRALLSAPAPRGQGRLGVL